MTILSVIRVCALLAAVLGGMYTLRNWRKAVQDQNALRRVTSPDIVVATVAHGTVGDELRLVLAQAILAAAAAISLLIQNTVLNVPVLLVFVCLAGVSFVLAFQSYLRDRRREVIFRMLRVRYGHDPGR